MPGIHDRDPSPVDRPPVSRVGDQLQRLEGDPSAVALDSEGDERLDARAVEQARREGWDHDLGDVVAPPDGETGPVATDRGDGDDPTATVPTDTVDAGQLDPPADADIGRGGD